jgi:hypothetical protein
LSALEPVPPRADSYEAVARKWLALYAIKKGLRSAGELERLLVKFVFPVWGKRDFTSIKRRDISELLDSIEKGSRWNADHVLSVIRGISKWFASRDDDYSSPFVAGMRRTKEEERERDRILDDAELPCRVRRRGAVPSPIGSESRHHWHDDLRVAVGELVPEPPAASPFSGPAT